MSRKTYSLFNPSLSLGALDETRWTQHTAFSVYGARVGLRTNNARALKKIAQAYPPHCREISSTRVDWLYSLYIAKPTRAEPRPFHLLYSNADEISRAQDLEPVLAAFDRDVQLAVAQTARRKVYVHAGVVGWQGRAIVIPGRTFTGKSTLVRELVRAGAIYYSDEYAVLDEQGRVHPFARQLALRDQSPVNRKLSFQELGGVIGTKSIPVGTVLVTKYHSGAKWRPQTLTPGLGTLALLANCVTARSGDPLVLQILSHVASQANILKSKRGEARAFAEQLLAALS